MKKTVLVVAALTAGCASTTAVQVSEARPAVAASRPSVQEITASLRDLLMTGFAIDAADLADALVATPSDAEPVENDSADALLEFDTALVEDSLPLAVSDDPELAEKARELHAMFDSYFPASVN